MGRAVWQEAVHLEGTARLDFLRTVARQRLVRLASLTQALARPWTETYTTEAPLDWYRTYPLRNYLRAGNYLPAVIARRQ